MNIFDVTISMIVTLLQQKIIFLMQENQSQFNAQKVGIW